jgi:hypothetical protein
MLADMRTLVGVSVFLGVAFIPRLLFGGPLTPDAPTSAVALPMRAAATTSGANMRRPSR